MALREDKRQRTRDTLFEAAVALFVEAGYDATTMDQIAARAVVSRATAFKYFPKKDDLLVEWAARRRAFAIEQAAGAGAERGHPEQIKRMILALAASYAREPAGRRFVEAWLSSGGPLKEEAWVSGRLFGDLVGDGQATGAVRPDVDPEVAGRLLLNVYLGVLYQWGAQRRSGAWLRRELDAALDVVVAGLRPGAPEVAAGAPHA